MEYLAEEASRGHLDSVFFLMPCHSTPFYSTLHKNISMRFLECSPRHVYSRLLCAYSGHASQPSAINNVLKIWLCSDVVGYVDEADQFMADPLRFLSDLYDCDEPLPLPSHLVLFDSLLNKLSSFLDNHYYELAQKLFHSHFPVDRELQSSVLVYVRNGTAVLGPT